MLASLGLVGCDNGLFAPATETVTLAVGGGKVVMGSTTSCNDSAGLACTGDRAPHPVRLSPFKIDKTEVTRLQFATCVVAGACRETSAPTFDPEHKNDPVLVNDPQAGRDYCTWRGLGLPTEAQFEFAARVDKAGAAHDYPWGDTKPSCDRVRYAGCGDTAPRAVGSATGDASADGVLDLAGGVAEWVDDAYDPHQGCLGGTGFSDICDANSAGCPGAHCTDASCIRGCLPPAEDNASVMQGSELADAPQCQQADANQSAPLDPVIRTSSKWGVIRGAGPLDRACSLAGFSRRHAAPGSYSAGFRCARTVDGFPSTPLGAYRFKLAGCPTPDHLVTIEVGDAEADGKPITFVLDHAGGRGPLTSVNSDGGKVRMMACGDAFVVRPASAAVIQVTVRDYLGCAAWSQKVGLRSGGDVPPAGSDLLPLAGAASCALPNAVGSCAGTCEIDQCARGFGDCDGDFANGCEKSVLTDRDNCGGCGHVCADVKNATVACLDGLCGVAVCSTRFADCDGAMGNGCETDVTTSAHDCGGCRKVCSDSHIALPTCTAGNCGGTCDAGWSDCNGNTLNDGCEVNTAGDPANCGSCGKSCSSNNISPACSGGSCSGRCLPNFADCNGDKRVDGCEAALETDVKNCGFCGNACPQGKSCVSGQCK